MQKHLVLLRLSYWSAALADFLVAYLVLKPERMGVAETVYPMGLMSAAALSWGVMLVMADRKPVERSWVLLPTILIVALLTLARLIFVQRGAVAFSLSFVTLGCLLIVLMACSYYCANRPGAKNRG